MFPCSDMTSINSVFTVLYHRGKAENNGIPVELNKLFSYTVEEYMGM